jgi:hypothetical protein
LIRQKKAEKIKKMEFTWNDNQFGYNEFETCPIRITATKGVSSTTNFDEIRVYDHSVWKKICTYKGNDQPNAQIVFRVNGVKVYKTAIKSVEMERTDSLQGDIVANTHAILNCKHALVYCANVVKFGFAERSMEIQKDGTYLMEGVPLASQIKLTIVS